MAMSKCRECGKAVSTLAKTCPSCGVPKPTKILKKKNSTKKIIKKTENHKVEDWRDDPRFSGKRKESSKKTEASVFLLDSFLLPLNLGSSLQSSTL